VRAGSTLAFWGWQGGAIQAYRDAVNANPNLVEAHFRLGEAFLRRQEWPAASSAFRHVLRLRPANEEAWGNLVLSLGKAGQVKDAIDGLQRLIQVRPRSAELHVLLGVLLNKSRCFHEAIRAFRRSILLRPASAAHLFYLGEDLLGAEEWRTLMGIHRIAAAIRAEAAAPELWGSSLNRPPSREDIAACRSRIAWLSAMGRIWWRAMRAIAWRMAAIFFIARGRARVLWGHIDRRQFQPHLALRSFRQAYRLLSHNDSSGRLDPLDEISLGRFARPCGPWNGRS
jgi:tetratricopeptide (TPR) repeat protein